MAMGPLALNDWTDKQAIAYMERIGGINERFQDWGKHVVTHKLWGQLPIESRQTFHDNIMLAFARGAIGYTLPRFV